MKRLIALFSVATVAVGSAASVLACSAGNRDYSFLLGKVSAKAGETWNSYKDNVQQDIANEIVKATGEKDKDKAKILAAATTQIAFSGQETVNNFTGNNGGYIPGKGQLDFKITFTDEESGAFQLWNTDFSKWAAIVAKNKGWKEGTGLKLGLSYYVISPITPAKGAKPSSLATLKDVDLKDIIAPAPKNPTIADKTIHYNGETTIINLAKKVYSSIQGQGFSLPDWNQANFGTYFNLIIGPLGSTSPKDVYTGENVPSGQDIKNFSMLLNGARTPSGGSLRDAGINLEVLKYLNGPTKAFSQFNINFKITGIAPTGNFYMSP